MSCRASDPLSARDTLQPGPPIFLRMVLARLLLNLLSSTTSMEISAGRGAAAAGISLPDFSSFPGRASPEGIFPREARK